MGSIDPYTASSEEERSGKIYIPLQMVKKQIGVRSVILLVFFTKSLIMTSSLIH